jgi:major membrane immunogen (membrane-anchored lipoprotein)
MGISDRPRINQEVDGISGATISATSMTQAVNKLLQSLSIVKENGAI